MDENQTEEGRILKFEIKALSYEKQLQSSSFERKGREGWERSVIGRKDEGGVNSFRNGKNS